MKKRSSRKKKSGFKPGTDLKKQIAALPAHQRKAID